MARTRSRAKAAKTSRLTEELDRESMSPTKRTEKWLQGGPTPKKDPNTHSIRKVKGAKVTKDKGYNQTKESKSRWSFGWLASYFGGKQESTGENEDVGSSQEEGDLEGETVIEDDRSSWTPTADNDLTLVEEYDENVREEIKGRTLSNRYVDYNDSLYSEWTDEEIWLFNKIAARGSEPLISQGWRLDFPTLPRILFTWDDDKAFIKNVKTSYTRAAQAFDPLIMAGGLVRSNIISNLPPERWLHRAVTNFHKWTLRDVRLNFRAHIPVIAIAAAKPHESTESVINRLTDNLHSLGRRYRDKWRHPDCSSGEHNDDDKEVQQRHTHALPTLFGFVIKWSVVALVTCDASVPNKPIRTLGTYDYTRNGQEAWHALAIAIAMVRGRNYLLGLAEEGELGPEIVDYGPDPDL